MNNQNNALLETFKSNGLIKLKNVLNKNDVSTLQKHVWKEIHNKFDIELAKPESWYKNPYNPAGFHGSRRLNQMNPVMAELQQTGKLDVIEQQVSEAVSQIFGINNWTPIENWYSLISFPGNDQAIPNKTLFETPRGSWHNDEPIVQGKQLPWSLFVFVFLDDVNVEHGPTLTVPFTQGLGDIFLQNKGVFDAQAISAFDHVNSALNLDASKTKLLPVGQLLPNLVEKYDWFKWLVDSNMDAVERENKLKAHNEFAVKPLTANKGDITIFDPRCLHSAGANVSEQPRQILRLDFRQTGISTF